jgi:hypothetical protein
MKAKLPKEIEDYIVYLSGLEVSCKLYNIEISRKILKRDRISFERLLLNFSGKDIDFLIKNNLVNNQELDKFKTESKYITGAYLDFAIVENDIKKCELIYNIAPHSVCSNRFVHTSCKNIQDFVKLNIINNEF